MTFDLWPPNSKSGLPWVKVNCVRFNMSPDITLTGTWGLCGLDLGSPGTKIELVHLWVQVQCFSKQPGRPFMLVHKCEHSLQIHLWRIFLPWIFWKCIFDLRLGETRKKSSLFFFVVINLKPGRVSLPSVKHSSGIRSHLFRSVILWEPCLRIQWIFQLSFHMQSLLLRSVYC